MTATTVSAVCPFCTSRLGADVVITGEVVTPTGSVTVDFADPSSFEAAQAAIILHRQFGGRPAVEHRCPVAGHQVFLYSDVATGATA